MGLLSVSCGKGLCGNFEVYVMKESSRVISGLSRTTDEIYAGSTLLALCIDWTLSRCNKVEMIFNCIPRFQFMKLSRKFFFFQARSTRKWKIKLCFNQIIYLHSSSKLSVGNWRRRVCNNARWLGLEPVRTFGTRNILAFRFQNKFHLRKFRPHQNEWKDQQKHFSERINFHELLRISNPGCRVNSPSVRSCQVLVFVPLRTHVIIKLKNVCFAPWLEIETTFPIRNEPSGFE